MEPVLWGNHEGKEVYLVTLENSHGTKAKFTNYGAIWVSLIYADNAGIERDCLLGRDSLEGYLQPHPFFGAVCGRVANRIGNASFTIGDQTYHVDKNKPFGLLHGGTKGFDKYVWDMEVLEPASKVKFSLVSPNGDMGFPGQVDISVTYTLTEDDEVKIEYHADVSEAPTILNITNHAYFNLTGEQCSALDHYVTIKADSYTVVDDSSVPTGEIAPVDGTPLDFRTPHKLGERINEPHFMLTIGKGYDFNYVISNTDAATYSAKAWCEKTGIVMEVFTTEPGVQLYTANWIEGMEGKNGVTHAN